MLNLINLEILDIIRRRYPHPIEAIQCLKSEEDGFVPLWNEEKTFDNRRTDDRDFQVGK